MAGKTERDNPYNRRSYEYDIWNVSRQRGEADLRRGAATPHGQRDAGPFSEGEHPRGEGGRFTAAQAEHHRTLTGAGYRHTGMIGRGESGPRNVAHYTHERGHWATVAPSGSFHHETPTVKRSRNEAGQSLTEYGWQRHNGRAAASLRRVVEAAHRPGGETWRPPDIRR